MKLFAGAKSEYIKQSTSRNNILAQHFIGINYLFSRVGMTHNCHVLFDLTRSFYSCTCPYFIKIVYKYIHIYTNTQKTKYNVNHVL